MISSSWPDPMPHIRLSPHGLRIPRRALAAWLGIVDEDVTVDDPVSFEEDQPGSSTPQARPDTLTGGRASARSGADTRERS